MRIKCANAFFILTLDNTDFVDWGVAKYTYLICRLIVRLELVSVEHKQAITFKIPTLYSLFSLITLKVNKLKINISYI